MDKAHRPFSAIFADIISYNLRKGQRILCHGRAGAPHTPFAASVCCVAYVVQGEKTIADMGFIAFKLFE
jgi:hypothetical protein